MSDGQYNFLSLSVAFKSHKVYFKSLKSKIIEAFDVNSCAAYNEETFERSFNTLQSQIIGAFEEIPKPVYNEGSLKGRIKPDSGETMSFDMFKLHFEGAEKLQIEVFTDGERGKIYYCFNSGKKEGALNIVRKYLELFCGDKFEEICVKEERVHITWKKTD